MSLDDDIAAWAAGIRLPPADADAIFRRIVATPAAGVSAAGVSAAAPSAAGPSAASAAHVLALAVPGLDPAWWRGYTAGFAARIVRSTAPVRPAA